MNWVSSDRPLDEEVDCYLDEVKRVSAGMYCLHCLMHNYVQLFSLTAGTLKHVETSSVAFESIFKYFSES